MDYDPDPYDEFLKLLNETYDTTDTSYIVTNSVQLCSKETVNQFGARFIPFFYCVTFVLGSLGNGFVLFILFKFEKLHTVTNIFLLNLVISNLLFAMTLPFWATYHLSEWTFGSFLCKTVCSAYFIGYYSSILFLMLMTFDRYLAVVHAIKAAKKRKKLYAIVAAIAVWCVSIVVSAKEIILRNVWQSPLNGLVCEETGFPEDIMNRWRLVSYYQQFLLFFLIPLFMVMYCYISITIRILATRMKEKCRTIKLIFVIIFTFFACWTPYNIVSLLRAIQLSSNNQDADLCAEQDSLDFAFYVTRNIAYLYCCISPVVYTFVGKKFQSHFRRLLGKHVPCLKRRLSVSSQMTRTTSQRSPHSVYE